MPKLPSSSQRRRRHPQPIDLTADPAPLLEPEDSRVYALVADGVQLDPAPDRLLRQRARSGSPGHRPGGRSGAAGQRRYLHRRTVSPSTSAFVPMERTDVQHSHDAVVRHAQRGARRDPQATLGFRRGRSCLPPAGSTSWSACGCTSGSSLPCAVLPSRPCRTEPKQPVPVEDLEMETPPPGSISIGQLIASIYHWGDTYVTHTGAKVGA